MIIKGLKSIGKPRMTQRDKWAKRECVVRYYEFADCLRLEAIKQSFSISDRVIIKIVIAMPASWSKKKTASLEGAPHQLKPDIDNIIKAIFDSLSVRDQSIWEVRATKHWGIDDVIEIINLEEK